MKYAFGHMNLPSEVFWSYSLREWQAAIKGYTEKTQGVQETPMTQAGLKSLMERYPDDRKTT